MSRFNETVQKIAASPRLVALMPSVSGELRNNSGRSVKVATKLPVPIWQDVGTHLLKNVGTATMVGGGALLASKLYDHMIGSQKTEDGRDIELGKLTAQSAFKARSLMGLRDHHEKALSTAMKDEIVAKADSKLMHSTYGTMKRFAPNLAADENAVTSFLREHALYGTGPSYAALKNLADAEQAVAKAGGV